MERLLGRRAWIRSLVIAASALALGGTCLVLGASTGAEATVQTLATFNAQGSYTWTVPSGVTQITITVYGASGGNVLSGLPPTLVSIGGAGGEAVGTFKVKPGETFEIVVGGRWGDGTTGSYGTAGFNGGARAASTTGLAGAGGGGGTDVRIGGKDNPCTSQKICYFQDRIIVGGGGGGAGSNGYGFAGGGANGAGPLPGTQTDSRELSCVSDFVACLGQGAGPGGAGSGAGAGGWFGSYAGNAGAGGSGGSGYVSSLALKASFPGRTHTGDGFVKITTP